jgi:hypothetical protein
MRSKIKVVLIVILAVALAWVAYNASVSAQEATYCPDGTYRIGDDKETGQPVCKQNPTGCPYGDSIPLDSPKCAPSDTDTNVGSKDPTPPDPDRGYYDAAGNYYDYQGNLITPAPQEDAQEPVYFDGK